MNCNTTYEEFDHFDRYSIKSYEIWYFDHGPEMHAKKPPVTRRDTLRNIKTDD